jgi:hypothetical protein
MPIFRKFPGGKLATVAGTVLSLLILFGLVGERGWSGASGPSTQQAPPPPTVVTPAVPPVIRRVHIVTRIHEQDSSGVVPNRTSDTAADPVQSAPRQPITPTSPPPAVQAQPVLPTPVAQTRGS